jgi:HTH-type transcriptional regulator/antitoxin HipB
MNIKIADRLVELRKKNGLSQEQLADKLGLSRQAVAKWERAEASPDTDNLICLAKLYGVSLDDLLDTDQSIEEIAQDTRIHEAEKKSESVHIDDSGIHLKSASGDEVHIQNNGAKIFTRGKDDEDDEDENKKGAKKYELLEEELNTLKENYSTLQNQYQELVNFKREIDNQKKDALIAEFYMLSDEDKADVISNKEKYTLDEIKAKLAVICFDKKINFTLNEEVDNNKEEEIVTYSLNDNNENNSLPEWVKAVKEQEKLG